MLIAVLQLAAGMVLLFVGGDYLVRGATRIALLARISSAVVGLTVVAMGTSFPELAVSVGAAARGATSLAYGNIIGSNVFNVGAILGVSALIAPVLANRKTIKIEYPFMLAAAVVVVSLCRDGEIDRVEGILFLVSLIAFIAFVVYLSRVEVAEDEALALEREVQRTAHTKEGAGRAWGVNVALVALGIVGLAIGADLVVRGAVRVAVGIGVDDRVIGLTLVAMGTSLPELATSAVAARHGEHEIALANIVGSNIFNLLGILGTTAAIFPVPIPAAALTDSWVMLGFCAAMFPLMYFGRRVSRRDGVLLLLAFAGYVAYVVLTR